jgi:Flp pilus assembly protein TadG
MTPRTTNPPDHGRRPIVYKGHRWPAGGDRSRDGGSTAVELALGVPVTILLAFLIIAAFHVARASADTAAAAAAAARAASLSRTPTTATTAAQTSAAANLSGRCTAVSVTVDTSNFHRGGTVTVAVACTMTTRGLVGVGLPGTVTSRATSTSPLDLHRQTALRLDNPAAAAAYDGEAR